MFVLSDINLLPQKTHLDKIIQQKYVSKVTKFITLPIITLLICISILGIKIYYTIDLSTLKTRDVEYIEKINKYNPDNQKLAELRVKTDSLNAVISNDLNLKTVFDDLKITSKELSNTLIINSITKDYYGEFVLQGVLDNYVDVAKFLSRIQTSSKFKSVYLQNASMINNSLANPKNKIYFEIKFNYNKE